MLCVAQSKYAKRNPEFASLHAKSILSARLDK